MKDEAEYYRSILDNLSGGLLSVDLQGNVVYGNETAPCGEGLVCVRSLLFDWGFCQAWCDLDAAASACQPGSRCRSIDAAGGRRGPVCVADND